MPRTAQFSLHKRRLFAVSLIIIASAICLVWPSQFFNWLPSAKAATVVKIVKDSKPVNSLSPKPLIQVPGGLSLGNYPTTSVNLGASATITPDAAPANALGLSVYTAPDFKGELTINPATGVVRVTNPYPMGTYAVKVRAIDSDGAVTIKTFQLNVQAGMVCQNSSVFTRAADINLNSVALAVGDFNNDGHQDLASLNDANQGSISIRLGDGAGGFTGSTIIPLRVMSANSIAVGDFNNDGNQDLVVLSFFGVSALIRLGDGTGDFPDAYRSEVILAEPPYTHPGNSAGPVSVEIGDFNNDGNQDLAVANRNNTRVAIRLGNGKGLFSGSTEIFIDSELQTNSIALADFNNDGNQDFITADYRGIISIRLGDGATGFNAPAISPINLGFGVNSITTGDFNNDGKQDFAAAGSDNAIAAVRLGDGAGGFYSPTQPTFSMGGPSSRVVIGDFNNDGNQDLAAGTYRPNTIAFRMGDGTGNFSGGRNLSLNASTGLLTVGDFNGDGKQDLAAYNNLTQTGISSEVSIYLGACNTAPTITSANVTPMQGSPLSNFTLASAVTDAQQPSDSLTMTINGAASATQNGVSISNLKISEGVVTADVLAACGATNATFTLRATDSEGLYTDSPLAVNVAPNTAPAIGYGSPQSIAYGSSLNVPPPTAADNGTVTYQVLGGHGLTTSPTVNSTGVVSITGAQPVGQHVITVRATDNCDAFTDASFTLNVTQAPQTITFSAIPNKTFGDATFDLIGTSSSGLPVSFNIVSGPATINNNALSLNGAGTVTVRASQTGNENYQAATPVERTFIINRETRTPIITSSVNPSEFGQSVTFTAVVPAIAGIVPTGTMQFRVDGVNLDAPASLNASGVATVTTSALPSGTRFITAVYSGDSNYLPSTGTMGSAQSVKSQPRLSINDVNLAEGNQGVTAFRFNVRLSTSSNLTVAVDYQTVNGTALAGSDYQSASGTLIFNPGEISKTATVLVNGDTANEGSETFFVHLSNPVNANFLAVQGVGTILNDDAVLLALSQSSYSVSEGAGHISVTVTRSGDPSIPVTVNFATSDTSGSSTCDVINGIASSRCDYAPMTGTLQLAAGETSKSFNIPIVDDGLNEGTERLTVKLSAPTGGASLGAISTATLSITDNEIAGVPPALKLMLDESGPNPNQASAIDSMLFLRDPFPVLNAANLLNQLQDRNTRIIILVANLQLTQGETASSVIVNLLGSNNQSYEIQAEVVQPLPFYNFTQVVFRLPDTLTPGVCTIKVKAQGQESNSGTIRIKS